MGLPARLTEDEITAAVGDLDGWELVAPDRIRKEFRFADFAEAMAFMNRCAPFADELNHHPEWSNVYNRVVIELTTHDVDGLSALDMEFAARANAAAG